MEKKLDLAPAYCVKSAAGEWQMKPTIDPGLVGAAVAGMVGTFLFVMWIGSKIIDSFCPWISRFGAQTAKQS
jgi:hypothetical protein